MRRNVRAAPEPQVRRAAPQLVREQAEGAARPVLVRFRRVVRATFGRTAREYHELLDRRGGEPPDEDPVVHGPVPPHNP